VDRYRCVLANPDKNLGDAKKGCNTITQHMKLTKENVSKKKAKKSEASLAVPHIGHICLGTNGRHARSLPV
jgi:hypothetical protein